MHMLFKKKYVQRCNNVLEFGNRQFSHVDNLKLNSIIIISALLSSYCLVVQSTGHYFRKNNRERPQVA